MLKNRVFKWSNLFLDGATQKIVLIGVAFVDALLVIAGLILKTVESGMLFSTLAMFGLVSMLVLNIGLPNFDPITKDSTPLVVGSRVIILLIVVVVNFYLAFSSIIK